ncbi:MAG: hypothetical protein KDE56_02915 [Anaerolineales bacterium]|nr:hypothetical protein [Anaerolineales bacterium]
MKPSTLTGIALTLFMLLLVLTSGFVFLYQGRQTLQTQYETTRDAFEQKQAESELRLTNSDGTRTAAEQSLIQQTAVVATTQQDMLKLVQESVQSQQTVEALQFEVTRLATDLSNAASTRAAAQPNSPAPEQPAIVEILAPSGDLPITQGDTIEYIVAARDVQGIASIQLKLNGRIIATADGKGSTFVTHRAQFPFLNSGSQTLEATMTNSSGGITMATPIRIEVDPAEENN